MDSSRQLVRANFSGQDSQKAMHVMQYVHRAEYGNLVSSPRTPIGQTGCARDEASVATGLVLPVDGGASIR